jgi:hypothetical protein
MSVYDENLNFLGEIDLCLKPDHDDITKVIYDPKAREVTGIDLETHWNQSTIITYTEAKEVIFKFLDKHKISGKRRSYRPLGQNLDFDRNFICSKIMDIEEWEKVIHYNTLDTLRIVTFLQDCGILATDIGNLSSLVEYFGLPLGEAHNAKEDVKMTVLVYKSLKSLISSKKSDFSGTDNNLLKIVEL